MQKKIVSLGNCRFEVLSEGQRFLGLGAIHIGQTQVRSGRLPLRPYTQSFAGHELADLQLQGIDEKSDEIRIRVKATFRPLEVKLLRDHSFDPIHDMGDWDESHPSGSAQLDLVLRPASDTFEGIRFDGFSYCYDYKSDDIPIFYLLDRATWELDGNIEGATMVSQSSCSAPTCSFTADNAYTTEGVIHFDDPVIAANPVMTHNLPRWASHGSFDFQYKQNKTLIGIFERVELIRSIQQRDAGKPELKTVDKHIFDQDNAYRTVAKSILLNTDAKTETDQRNLWTWIFDAIHGRARAEFGLAEEPLRTRLSHNFWGGFTYDSYRKDLIPAAAALGVESIFIDNTNKSAMTEEGPLKGTFTWNMCCGHEYEPAPKLGGPEKLKQLVKDVQDEKGIRIFGWTNNDQALSSPLNKAEREDGRQWYVLLEDTRQKWGGAYMGCMNALNFANDEPRNYWVNCLKKIKDTTGLAGYLFDSFYNLGFFPVNYAFGKPRTQWRQLVGAFKELQDYGVHFLIESFGPFGSPAHGCPASYADPENLFAAYKLTVSLGYTTVPSGGKIRQVGEPEQIYRFLAHMTSPSLGLFINKQRIDQAWGDEHRRILADYRNHREKMHKRFLQEDDQAILWHDKEGAQATIWNFTGREVSLPGKVKNLTTGQDLPKAERYRLEALNTYAITGTDLPMKVG